ncbi:MAG: NAD(P)-dependent oxidoreductase [Oscillospiraceae bacterium]|nr:NAD(P)-dependent oxidoreductase [Oscillospiraceae bacterium]
MRLCSAGAAAGAYAPLTETFPRAALRERFAAFAASAATTEQATRPAGFRAPSSAGGERLRTQQTGQPTCVMICGNVKLLDAESLKKASDYYRVIVTGELSFDPPRSRKLHVYPDGIVSESFERLIHSHNPDAIWYISGYADDQDGLDNEPHVVDTLMKTCDANDISKLIVVSSLSSFDYVMGRDQDGREEKRFTTARAFGCDQVEQRIRFLSALYGQKVILLRAPFLVNNNNKSTRLGAMLSEVIRGEVARLPYEQDQAIDFLSVNNLTELLISVTEESTDKAGEYAVFSGFTHSSRELGEAIMGFSEEAKIAYGEERSERIRFNAHFDS